MKEWHEILSEETSHIFDEREGGITGIENAMKKFSEQQSISMLKWIRENDYCWTKIGKEFKWCRLGESKPTEYITDEQLYNKYLESCEQKKNG